MAARTLSRAEGRAGIHVVQARGPARRAGDGRGARIAEDARGAEVIDINMGDPARRPRDRAAIGLGA